MSIAVRRSVFKNPFSLNIEAQEEQYEVSGYPYESRHKGSRLSEEMSYKRNKHIADYST